MLKENDTTFVLKNLATGNRIKADGRETSRFVARKLWFKEVTEPSRQTTASSGSGEESASSSASSAVTDAELTSQHALAEDLGIASK